MSMAAKVVNFRKNTGEGPLGYFDVLLGDRDESGTFTPLMSLRGASLRRSTAGRLFMSPPAKQRIDRQTKEPVIGQNGKAIWDNHYQVYEEKQGDKIRPTKAAYALQDDILRQAEDMYNGVATSDAGRGAPKKATTTTKAAVSSPDNDDDDLPF